MHHAHWNFIYSLGSIPGDLKVGPWTFGDALMQGAWQLTGYEGSYLANCQTNLVIALHALSLLFCSFINTTAIHLGRYKPSYSTKELHDWYVKWNIKINAVQNKLCFNYFLLWDVKQNCIDNDSISCITPPENTHKWEFSAPSLCNAGSACRWPLRARRLEEINCNEEIVLP